MHRFIPARQRLYLVFAAALCLVAACSENDTVAPSNATTGTIVIDLVPESVAATWQCRLMEGSSVSGQGDSVLVDMAPGIYELTWGAWQSCYTPEPDTLVLAAGDTIAFTGTYPCYPPPPPPDLWLYGIAGDESGNIYAGGTGGALFRYDGLAWSQLPTGTHAAITSFWIDDDGTAWACGSDGLVLSVAGTTVTLHDVGTDENLYAIGRRAGVLHVGGRDGVLRRRDGGSWSPVTGSLALRDPFGASPIDTLHLAQDVAAITTIGDGFLGGAYVVPDWIGDPHGLDGTAGMVLTADTDFDWWLQPLPNRLGEDPGWVTCASTGPASAGSTWLGTMGGWLLRLQGDDDGRLLWSGPSERISAGPGNAVNDLWLAAGGDLYLVTICGRIVHVPPGGEPEVLSERSDPLTGIWGTDPGEFYVTGHLGRAVLRCAHDPVAGTFTAETVALPEGR